MTYYISKDEEFLNLLPSKWWKRFFIKFDEIDDLPDDEWKPHHLLGHFNRRFHETYGKRFSFNLKGRPSSCPEIYLLNQMIAVLGTSNPRTVKEYIDWVFDTKLIPTKRKLLSIGFFSNAQFCNDFHHFRKQLSKISRATEISTPYKEIIEELNLPVKTFGDLLFAKQIADSTQDPSYQQMFQKLNSVGFDMERLEGIK